MENRVSVIRILFFVIILLIGILIGIGTISNAYALNLKSNKIDIQKMSEEMGISIGEIKQSLGDTSVTTANEARAAWYKTQPGSKENKIAFDKWVSLANTVEEIQDAWNHTNPGSEAQKKATLKWIELASNPFEARAVWERTRGNSDEKDKAFEKMASFYIKK